MVSKMDTARINICYRPIRVVWAIHSAELQSFRDAVKLTHTLRGGRYNPIVFADKPDEARDIIESFRADMIVPVGGSKEANELPDRFPHLINPFFNKAIFEKDMRGNARARLLDLHNSLNFWHDTPEWKALDERGIRSFTCLPDDPLADAILARHGGFPDSGEVGIDYGELLSQATLAIDVAIDKGAPLPLQLLQHPSFNYLSRHGLRRHYTVRPGWDFEGYFVGDAGSLDDLAYFWNLRAADISLEFLDPSHIARYEHFKAECDKLILARVANLADYRRNIAIWTREERIQSALELFEGRRVSVCRIGDDKILERWRGSPTYDDHGRSLIVGGIRKRGWQTKS